MTPDRPGGPVREGERVTAGRGTTLQRVRARLVAAGSFAACHLPEAPLVALAGAAGELWYRLDRRRAEQGRRNLRRVCEWLARDGSGPPGARAAASDPAALERLLRSAFRHQARYYLEVALTPSMRPAYVRERLIIETPEAVDAALSEPGPIVIVGLHFGAIELPALYLADRLGVIPTAPMETIDDPPLQDWFRRTRASVGLRIVGLREARRELSAALARGEPAGLIADRDIAGGGIPVELFGHPAPLPIGPALLAYETGARAVVANVRRVGDGRYRGRLEPIERPSGGTRREWITAFLAAEARAFERAVAIAPDQWWAIFFPIWPDLGGREH